MKKFKYPLSISGTPEELKALVPKLEALGYTPERTNNGIWQPHTPLLITNYTHLSSVYGFNQCSNQEQYNRTEISASNPELVLALAACVEGDKFHVGEWVVRLDSLMWASSLNENCPNGVFKSGNIARITKVGVEDGYIPLEINFNGELYGMTGSSVRKLTKEEIISHFAKQEKNMTQQVSSSDKNPTGKKIKGYKFKPGFESYRGAAMSVAGMSEGGEIGLEYFLESRQQGAFFKRLKSSGILDLWFEPVYEEEFKVGDWVNSISLGTFKISKIENSTYGTYAYNGIGTENANIKNIRKATSEEIEAATKPKEIVINIQAEDEDGDDNSFDVHVSKGKILTGTEDVDVEQFKRILAHCKTTLNGWECSVRTVDIGCKKNISVADLQKVLDAYNSF